MTELSAMAGSEGYAACDDDGWTLSVGKGRPRPFPTAYALSIPTISHSALSLYMHS